MLRPKPRVLTRPNRPPITSEQHRARCRACSRRLTAARAAGVNKTNALARLHDLERRGEVHRVGNRWSIEPPPDAVALAMDRLQARTSKIRIVRDRTGVG
jgi:hypothetical protein